MSWRDKGLMGMLRERERNRERKRERQRHREFSSNNRHYCTRAPHVLVDREIRRGGGREKGRL